MVMKKSKKKVDWEYEKNRKISIKLNEGQKFRKIVQKKNKL